MKLNFEVAQQVPPDNRAYNIDHILEFYINKITNYKEKVPLTYNMELILFDQLVEMDDKPI